MKRLLSIIFIASISATSTVQALDYRQTLDAQARFNDQADDGHNNQYRVRFSPSIYAGRNNSFSLNAMVATGTEFSNSHNLIGDSDNDKLRLRHLFVKHETYSGKTEIGIIPTDKKKNSATNISENGWISGLRRYQRLSPNTYVEVVFGQLDNYLSDDAMSLPENLDYIEVEISGREKEHYYEFALERIAEGDYVRARYQYTMNVMDTLYFEYTRRVDEKSEKYAFGVEGEVVYESNMNYNLNYIFVSHDYGDRALLQEDFMEYGHGVTAEVNSQVGIYKNIRWFVRADIMESDSRLLSGISLKFW